ncbi:PREDICTED: uncharacterized protein LOC106909301 [Scomber scombrus]|uniref:PREDICTED: uncharacterized protein LOC106909301 n=1 Tax=Scomber scombrus TaxID=13677 RepID=A0AAV1QI25_SCOSC
MQALGNSIPPFFVFPKKYKDFFVHVGPPGSVGSSNGSGWMQEKDFFLFLEHFAKHTKVSPERKVLLLLGNHSSHISVKAVNYCKANGIVLLSLPPHCSHKLQPLDRSVYGPLKKAVNSAGDAWMRMNPVKTMTIYDVPSLMRTALPTAASPSNIQAGFRCTGIWPFNPNIFQDHDFAPSQVTDRPDPASMASVVFHQDSLATTAASTLLEMSSAPTAASNLPQTSSAASSSAPAEPFTKVSSPSTVRPFPKAGPRNTTGREKEKVRHLYRYTSQAGLGGRRK